MLSRGTTLSNKDIFWLYMFRYNLLVVSIMDTFLYLSDSLAFLLLFVPSVHSLNLLAVLFSVLAPLLCVTFLVKNSLAFLLLIVLSLHFLILLEVLFSIFSWNLLVLGVQGDISYGKQCRIFVWTHPCSPS